MMRGIARLWRRAVFCLLSSPLMACAASRPGFQIDVWQSDEGLPQNSVTAITQTTDGYLWLGTQDGLARFDGVRFQVFNENNTPAIRNSRIVQLFEDRQKTLWIGTEQGGVVCLRDGEFRRSEMPGRGTTHNYARVFCSDAAGALWVVSCEWQLMRFADGAFTVPSSQWRLSGLRCGAAASDRNGQVWVGTEQELAVWQHGAFQPVWSGTNGENSRVEFLAASHTGGCWVAADGRLRKFDSGRWVADLGNYAWTNRPIYDLREDRQGCLWVATLGSGLFRYGRDGAVLPLTTKEGMPTDFVRCVTEDREGNIWAGTDGGGLCRLKPAIFQTFTSRQGLSSDQVMSVFESEDGALWVGTNGDGLDRLQDGQVTHYGPEHGLKNGHVWSVVEDRQGTLWVGTWDGLFRREREDDRFVCLSDGANVGWQVLGLYEDTQGGLWLGQQAIGALTRLHHEARKGIKIPGASAGLDVRALAEDREGHLWIGTNDEGLYRMKDGQFAHFGRKEGLQSEAVWCLHLDEDDGSLWIGTRRGGLSRWHEGQLRTWTTDDGLINNVICQILEDGTGNLWLGSHGGVFRVSKAELTRYTRGQSAAVQCIGYGKADGLPSIECQGGFQPSGCKSRDGRLWFPTVKGLAALDPTAVVQNPLSPPVVIEEIAIDGAVRQPKPGFIGPNNPAGGWPTTVIIPPGKRRIDFSYTALSFTAPGEVRFKYRLEGLEPDWNEAGARRTANYNHVPPGDYRFQVIACNNDGVWNEVGATLAIAMRPYFWQTKWFLGLTVLTVMGVVGGAARHFETRKLQRRLARAERERAIESERARIAKDMHDDLGANLTEIAMLSELARNPETQPEQAQADVSQIAVKARALTRSLDEIVWAVDPQNDSLENFVTYVCSYAEDYLRLARIACRLDVPDRLPAMLLNTHVRHNLFLVLKEALHNVVKHARATEVWIHVAHNSGRFALAIQDNGQGFVAGAKPGDARVPGERPWECAPQRSGLANMRKRTESIGGQFDLESRPGSGARVSVTLRAVLR